MIVRALVAECALLLRQITTDAGFSQFRRVASTPFNYVYEARL